MNETSELSLPELLLYGLIPLIGMGALITYLAATEGGLKGLRADRPPVEKLHITRISLPEEDQIKVHVTNEGPEPVQIAQVMVDEAYWTFSKQNEGPIQPRSSNIITIPYMWVKGNKHEVTLVTARGGTFTEEIPVAVQTPGITLSQVLQFGLVGLYVGVIPVFLGVLWYPLLRRASAKIYHFVLALTMGLLAYLAVGTWLDALEFAGELAEYWQGVPMTVLVTLLVFGGLVGVGQLMQETSDKEESSYSTSLRIAYVIALGIGMHNLGEGLAIGAAYASGENALWTSLVIGFTLHNLTEGVGIAAPVSREDPGLFHFALLILLGGSPAILGMWIGGFSYQPILGVLFLSVGVGAILQVLWEIGKMLRRETAELQRAMLNPTVLSGFFAGAFVMFTTGYFI